MEVILMDDITNLGHEGEVVKVADGYARNYLIPQDLAVEATVSNLKQLEQQRRAIEAREAHKRAGALELGERLKQETILIRASAGEGGRLHGEVTPQNIADAVAQQLDIAIERRGIDIPVPIRETGDYLITATLYKDTQVELPVRVVGMDDDLTEVAEEPAEEAEAGADVIEQAKDEADEQAQM